MPFSSGIPVGSYNPHEAAAAVDKYNFGMERRTILLRSYIAWLRRVLPRSVLRGDVVFLLVCVLRCGLSTRWCAETRFDGVLR